MAGGTAVPERPHYKYMHGLPSLAEYICVTRHIKCHHLRNYMPDVRHMHLSNIEYSPMLEDERLLEEESS